MNDDIIKRQEGRLRLMADLLAETLDRAKTYERERDEARKQAARYRQALQEIAKEVNLALPAMTVTRTGWIAP